MILFTVSLITFFIIGFGIAFGSTSAGIVGGQGDYIGIYNNDGMFSER